MISNDSERQSRRNSAVKTSNNAGKKLLINVKSSENENKLQAKPMQRRMPLDRQLKRGDSRWRRQNRRELHLLRSDLSQVGTSRALSCRRKLCHRCHSAVNSVNQLALLTDHRRTLGGLSTPFCRMLRRLHQNDLSNKTLMSIMPDLQCNAILRHISTTMRIRSVERPVRLSMTMRI